MQSTLPSTQAYPRKNKLRKHCNVPKNQFSKVRSKDKPTRKEAQTEFQQSLSDPKQVEYRHRQAKQNYLQQEERNRPYASDKTFKIQCKSDDNMTHNMQLHIFFQYIAQHQIFQQFLTEESYLSIDSAFKSRTRTLFSEEEQQTLHNLLFKRQSRHSTIQHPLYLYQFIQKMYNQYSQLIVDIYRHYFGYLATRQRFKARKDAFYQFCIDQDNQSDQQILRRLSVAVTKISDMCFRECVDTNYQIYTSDEEYCVKNCVDRYFGGYEQIALYTNRKLFEE